MQNIQSLGASNLYGNYTSVGGGATFSRSEIDATRMMSGRVPDAEYPDGYLGTIPSRRGDRVLDSLRTRQTMRSYQRGVHNGTKIPPADYFWPAALQPDRAVKNQRAGRRTAPILQLAPAPHLVNDGKADHRANEPARINPVRSAQLAHLQPAWG